MLKYSQEASKKVWDNFYRNRGSHKLIRKINELYFASVFQKTLLGILKKDRGSLLEAGCGEAIMSARLAKLGYAVTLLDISKSALEQAKLNFKLHHSKGAFVRGSIFKMRFPSNSFDATWNQGVIEHFDKAENAIKEMYRVTKKNGYVIILVPAMFSPLYFYDGLLKFLGLERYWPFEKQIFYSKSLLHQQILHATGIRPTVRRILFSFGFSMVGYVKKT